MYFKFSALSDDDEIDNSERGKGSLALRPYSRSEVHSVNISLPIDIFYPVFTFGTPQDLAVWCKVSKLWNRLAQDPTLWIRYHAGGLNGLIVEYKERIHLQNEERKREARRHFLVQNHIYRKLLCFFLLPILFILSPVLLLLNLEKIIFWAWLPTMVPLALFFAFLAQLHLCLLRYSVDQWQTIHQARKGFGFLLVFIYLIYLAGVADGEFPILYGSYLLTMLPSLPILVLVFSPPMPQHREIMDVLFQIPVSSQYRGGYFHRLYLIAAVFIAFLLYGLNADSRISIHPSVPFVMPLWLITPLISHSGFTYFRPLSWSDVAANYFAFLWQFSLWLIPYLSTINIIGHKSFIVLFTPYWVFLAISILCLHFRFKQSHRFT